MSEIRPFTIDDLDQVTALYERAARSGVDSAPLGLTDYFVRTLVEQPWADPAIPSLVYQGDDGRITGFIGSHVRRARLGERMVRVACSGQLVSDPASRNPATGALLMRAYLNGNQDLTITDGATPLVADMWTRLGGAVLHPASIVWTRLLRPTQAAGDRILTGQERSRWWRAARPVLALVDGAARPLVRPPVPDPELDVRDLTPADLVEQYTAFHATDQLRLELDEPFATWLLRETAAVSSRGDLVAQLVSRSGKPVGWYVAYLAPGATSQVLEVVASSRDELDRVLDHLLARAWEAGSVAVVGRVDPWVFETVARRRLVLRAGERVLVHTRDPDLERVITSGRTRLSRLAGEWWMGHHVEPFDDLEAALVTAGSRS
jgi:hypothetical protein